MERGLLWLPLLVAFIWLAWSGWNEYQKLETFKVWATDFDNAKFDIYAVLGKKERQVTWGKPTRKGVVDLSSFSLDNVKEIKLLIAGKSYDKAFLSSTTLNDLPNKGQTALDFNLIDRESIQVPFTDISLAAKWCKYLEESRSDS